MKRLFAVIQTHGPAFQAALPLERQAEWRAHADFMNALEAEGVVLVGGPLAGTDDVLLILRAADADEIRWRFAADPWVKQGLLRLKQVFAWQLRLGEDFEQRWVSRRAMPQPGKSPDRRGQKPGKARIGRRKMPGNAGTRARRMSGKARKSP
jgi:uncharacterized protein YciI